MRATFANSKSDVFYDLEFDAQIIATSIWQQYHIDPHEQEDLTLEEFLLSVQGLGAETPLGKIVQIRAENNPERIKKLTIWERKIRNDWAAFKAKHMIQGAERTQTEARNEENFRLAMKSMYGKKGG